MELLTTVVAPPDIPGLYARYTSDSWSFSENRWMDVSGNNRHSVLTRGTINVGTSTDPSGRTVKCVMGDVNAGVQFPESVLPETFTLFHLARYTGADGRRGRILDGIDKNWLDGFWDWPNKNGRKGVAFRTDKWITSQTSLPNVMNWLVSASQKSTYRADGVVRHNGQIGSSAHISINYGSWYTTEASDWAVAEVLVYDRELSVDEIIAVEQYLTADIDTYCITALGLENILPTIFHYGNFSTARDTYGDGTIENAAKNGRIYADTPIVNLPYWFGTFTSTTTTAQTSYLWTPNFSGTAEILIVGGGGGGGKSFFSGGGGGGGVVYMKKYLVQNSPISLTVGNGGKGAPLTLPSNSTTLTNDASVKGETGYDSSFGTVIAKGGGGAGSRNNSNGLDGGSGGGGGRSNGVKGLAIQSSFNLTEQIISQYGNDGGNGAAGGGGGGGAGGAGTDAPSSTNQYLSGNGGDGLSFIQFGTTQYFGAGGGPGWRDAGGNGGSSNTGGRGGKFVDNLVHDNPLPQPGKEHTGSGGGGTGGHISPGGDGGSGAVVVGMYQSSLIGLTLPLPVILSFHYGDFDNVYNDGNVVTAAENGHIYANTPTGSYSWGTLISASTASGQTTYTWIPPTTVTADVLLVAGGGGVPGDVGGGGGGGGLLFYEGVAVANEQTIIVGNGGVGAPSGQSNNSSSTNGINTSAFGYTAIGGGRGGLFRVHNGGTGGSGGGASRDISPGNGTTGQGFSGGAIIGGYINHNTGGGGGAGGAGGGSSGGNGGNGGIGVDCSDTFGILYGDDGWFAGGGGGGSTGTIGLGGKGGGGDGKDRNTISRGNNGQKHTGGGGGGNAHPHYGGADGGSGIVIIKF